MRNGKIKQNFYNITAFQKLYIFFKRYHNGHYFEIFYLFIKENPHKIGFINENYKNDYYTCFKGLFRHIFKVHETPLVVKIAKDYYFYLLSYENISNEHISDIERIIQNI